MADDYTPDTDEVRAKYWSATRTLLGGARGVDLGREFDRWLEQVRAEVWDEGHSAGYEDRKSEGQFVRFVAVNPYRDKAAE